MSRGDDTPCWLTIDVGNSRAKACLVATLDRTVLRRASWPGLPELSALESFLDELSPRAAAVSSVRGQAAYDAWAEGLEGIFEGPVWTPPPTGLWLDVDSPDTVGHDRLFAGLGALARTGRATLVVDAGTALTVDVLLHGEDERRSLPRRARPAPEGVRGVFLGGAIAPGPDLLVGALAQGGAQLPEIEGVAQAPAWGRSTHEALRAGVAVGFQGAARELVDRLRAETGLTDAPLLLTGGAAPALAGILAPDEMLPDLVHEGLAIALAGSLESDPTR